MKTLDAVTSKTHPFPSFNVMGAANCKKNNTVAPDEIESNNTVITESNEKQQRYRDKLNCFHCNTLLNQFNKCSGGVCYHCLQVNSSKTEILAHAGPVAHALETSYRVEDFVKGIDELRDLYFHSQIVSKHFQREAEKDASDRAEMEN